MKINIKQVNSEPNRENIISRIWYLFIYSFRYADAFTP